MRNFRDNRSSDSRGSDRGGRRFGGRDAGPVTMFKATCSDCGKACEVPFRPTGERPVFCSDCFKKHGPAQTGRSDSKSYGRSDSRSYSRDGFDSKRMFKAICDNCGKECEVPFRPTGEKPVYCSQCFDRGSSSTSKGKSPDQFKQQFDTLNAKLDKILKTLAPAESPKVFEVTKPASKKEETKKSKSSKALKAAPKKAKAKKSATGGKK